MAANPFYVQPAVAGRNFQQGLSGLGQVLEEQQAAKQKQQDTEEMLNLFRSGQPGQVAEFMIRKPELAQQLQSTIGWRDAQTQQNAYDTFKRIEQGADPVAALSERLMFLEQSGADPTDTIEELQEAMDNPEQYVQTVPKKREAFFPQQYLQELKLENEKRKLEQGEQLSGDAGTVAQLLFGTSDLSRLTPEERQQVNTEVQRRGGTGQSTANMAEYNLALQQGYNGSFLDFINERSGRGDVKLSAFAEKQLSAATNEAVEATNNVERFNALADEIETADFGGGLFGGSWREKLKDVTGQQDIVTELRRKFNAVKSSQVVQNLPPGAASDADIALALSGFPSDNYNAEQLASFMRGLSKMEGLRAQFAEFRANYISENKSESGLLKAWKAQTGQEGGQRGGQGASSGFTDADFAAAAREAGVSVQEFRRIIGQ